jgi:hypothetical protein
MRISSSFGVKSDNTTSTFSRTCIWHIEAHRSTTPRKTVEKQHESWIGTLMALFPKAFKMTGKRGKEGHENNLLWL